MKTLGNITWGAFAVLSLPVVLTLMVFRNMIDAKSQKQIANETSCEQCGKVLGKVAISESNHIVVDEWKQLQAKFPGIKFRKIRKHHAICTGCGQKYFYTNQGKTYLPVVAHQKASSNNH